MRAFLLLTICAAAAWAQPSELERAQTRLRDWPNLARYREANASLTAEDGRVVFLGASMFDLWGKKHGSFFPGKPYINRGISGQTTPQMLARFRQDVINLHPKVAVVMGGGNDLAGNTGPTSVEDIENNLASIAELAKANGIGLVLVSQMPSCDAPGQRRPLPKLLELNTWMQDYAAKNGHVYLDWFTPLADESGGLKRELTYDCLHVNSEGYALMAPLAEKAIAEALKK